jgi:hypothetical protein
VIAESNPAFGNVHHPLALPIVKGKAKFMMNQTYVDHKAYEWEGSYAYSSIVWEGSYTYKYKQA